MAAVGRALSPICVYTARKNYFVKIFLLQNSTGTRTKNIFLNEQKVGMILQKRPDTRGVGISSMRKSIYLCKVQSIDDNCGEWVEFMGVASGCGEQEAGLASGREWNLWVWLYGGI